MPAHKPEECDLLLIEAMEQGDVDAMLSLYEPNATFVVSPGQVVTGRAAIRQVLQGYIAAKATGKIEEVRAVPSADGSVAVTRTKGRFTSPDLDGKPVTTRFHSPQATRRNMALCHRRSYGRGLGANALNHMPRPLLARS